MSFAVSLNPTYLCNYRCDFCYLTKKQLADKSKIELTEFEQMFQAICHHKDVSHVDLYGGEIGLLSNEYLEGIHKIITTQSTAQINVITNLSKIHDYFLRDDVTLSVSYDFKCRQDHEKVLANILSLPKDVAILMLASPCLVKQDVNEMVDIFNSCGNVESVEIKPYSSNQANQLEIDYTEYEDFVKKWLEVDKDFTFMNEEYILESLNGQRNAFSDDHVYITPNGKYGVLEFDENDNEYFMEFTYFGDYLRWADREKDKVNVNGYCKQCEFKGSCLTEHYREVRNLDKSCNGFYHLLSHYKENYLAK